jgi:O-antigen/teichoic acid export membrane protein
LILGKVLGPAAVVPYFCTGKVLSVLSNQPQMLAQTAQPALSELRTSADRDRLHQVATALTRAILIFSGGVVGLVVLVNEGFVRWWVGAEQYGGLGLTVALAGGMLVRHWNMTAMYSLFALGHDKRLSLTSLIDGVVTVVASIVLTRSYGVLGVALGSLTGVVLVGLPANLGALARETGASVHRVLADQWPWAWRFGLTSMSAAVLGQVWVPTTLPALVLASLLFGTLYLGLMWPMALREPLGQYVRPQLAALRRLGQAVAS